MAGSCSHLFIDEAHHISAPTWARFRRFFLRKPILQFTATPFRRDGKHVDGKIIYKYPLRKAQSEGYFTPITFRPVREYRPERADRKIADVAVRQLERDLAEGLDHIVMARADSIDRAEEVYEVYRRLAPEHNPLLIHSRKRPPERRDAIRQLQERRSRLAVCIDMLGEGFDLPELKIAALHDMHRSLAITLQFIGRFTRTAGGIGDATAITNIADARVEERLRELYAEDADWDLLLARLSEGATGRQVRRAQFLEDFTDIPDEIPLQNVFPKMSAVAYRTKCENWRPDEVRDVVGDARLCAGPTINHRAGVMLFVTREIEPISWGDIKDIRNTIWDLYLLHWDKDQQLLFIHSSNNDTLHEDLAKAVAGEDAELIRGEQAFRGLHGINRLTPMNLGLNHSVNRAARFTMHVGSDVRQGLAQANLENRIKSNLFGVGYENGSRTSMGCSYKGRVWSYRIATDIEEWAEWCRAVGTKLLDDSISVKEILKHVLVADQVHERPALVPLVIEWPEEFLERSEDAMQLDVAGEVVPFVDAGIELVEHAADGPLRFRVLTETRGVEYELRFRRNSLEYMPVGPETVDFVVGRRRQSLAERFQIEPPIIRFGNGAFLRYNLLYSPTLGNRAPFDARRIEVWDWSGTDLRKESQKLEKHRDSIQYRVIQELLREDHEPRYDIVFDDDASNEAADVVALKVAGDRLIVHLFHCKYSQTASSGARVNDLYAVCGQAQRSISWGGDVEALLDHLRRREVRRLQQHDVSRFERGDLDRIEEIRALLPSLEPECKIFVVQPGLSKGMVGTDQLELLAVTELYLKETYAIEFG
ncbi:MAG: helicase, partial [Chloroflexota bacterium]|nr:helicase [Chloroflexota bacterium]